MSKKTERAEQPAKMSLTRFLQTEAQPGGVAAMLRRKYAGAGMTLDDWRQTVRNLLEKKVRG